MRLHSRVLEHQNSNLLYDPNLVGYVLQVATHKEHYLGEVEYMLSQIIYLIKQRYAKESPTIRARGMGSSTRAMNENARVRFFFNATSFRRSKYDVNYTRATHLSAALTY